MLALNEKRHRRLDYHSNPDRLYGREVRLSATNNFAQVTADEQAHRTRASLAVGVLQS